MAMQPTSNRPSSRSMPPSLESLWQQERLVATDWQQGLPVLAGHGFRLRELRASDAPSLHALLATEEVARFISPPPTTVEGFATFIEWTHKRRAEGTHVCFAVVPEGLDVAVGLIQFHAKADDYSVAEWGFVLGRDYWGTGLFVPAAHLVLEFAFEHVGVERMEARAVTINGRGNGALRKLGAVQEATLRKSFAKGQARYDQYLWSVLADDWRRSRIIWIEAPPTVH